MRFSTLDRALEVYTAFKDGDFDARLECSSHSAYIRTNNGTEAIESFYVKVTNLTIDSRSPERFARFQYVCKRLNVEYRQSHGSAAIWDIEPSRDEIKEREKKRKGICATRKGICATCEKEMYMPTSARLCRHCEADEVFERRFGISKEESHVQPV